MKVTQKLGNLPKVSLRGLVPVKKKDLTRAFGTSGLRKNIVLSYLHFSLYNKLVIFGIIYFPWLPPVMCPQVTPLP